MTTDPGYRTVLVVEVPAAVWDRHYAVIKEMRERCLAIINEDRYMLMHPSTSVGRF